MKIAKYEIKNKNLEKIAETLSDNGYNPDWIKNNSEIGDWYITDYDNCEAISIPSKEGFGEMVADCFINECDKSKEIDWRISRYERVIFVKRQYNDNFTEKDKEFLWELEDKNLGI
tara:strand:- start:20 stop:367 length:348 start_codon:yes stop_codon:yes gene_type:complete